MDQFDGDVKINMTPDGGQLNIENGQPEMTGGLENYLLIALLSSDYYGNDIAEDPEKLEEGLDKYFQEPVTNATRNNIIKDTDRLLAPMITEGLAKSVTPSAFIQSTQNIILTIDIEQPDKSVITKKFDLNWTAQEISLIA